MHHTLSKNLFASDEREGAIPNHDSIKIGTLNHILADVAGVIGVTKSELVNRLFHD